MPDVPIPETILAIDIGATTIKLGLTDDRGTHLAHVRQVPTPYPCSPERLVDVVVSEIIDSGSSKIGVGFPGDFRDGLVIEPGNLSRRGGIRSDVDPELHLAWMGFDLQRALCTASHRDVRVVNDATLAALGCSVGEGRELVMTLGTGLGIALVVDGEPVRIRDVGAELFVGGRTYDELLGEPSRDADQSRWRRLLYEAVEGFVAEFNADTVHFGGGNARRIDVGWFADMARRFIINDNDVTLRGAARLFCD